jgi:Domain of unknown function (DUF4349)
MRKSLVVISTSALLLGCGRPDHLAEIRLSKPPSALPSIAPDAIVNNSNGSFSYTHMLTLLMPHMGVEPRYARARDRCLHDTALNCKLVSSSLDKEDVGGYSAQLVVAVPHEKVAGYEKGLAAPVAGEKPGDAAIIASSTTAQNVTQEASAAGRKTAQLSDYRDRLLGLLKRPNLSVDDLIKVEGELAKTQSDLDDALAQKTDVDDRVAREQITISLNERVAAAGPFQPIANVWRNAAATLAESAANMLEFVIAYIPWLPLMVAALFVVRWFWRIARRRAPVARSAPE